MIEQRFRLLGHLVFNVESPIFCPVLRRLTGGHDTLQCTRSISPGAWTRIYSCSSSGCVTSNVKFGKALVCWGEHIMLQNVACAATRPTSHLANDHLISLTAAESLLHRQICVLTVLGNGVGKTLLLFQHSRNGRRDACREYSGSAGTLNPLSSGDGYVGWMRAAMCSLTEHKDLRSQVHPVRKPQMTLVPSKRRGWIIPFWITRSQPSICQLI